MQELSFVIVSGFCSSGSSAVVDLLKEFKGFYEPNAEIRFLRDPYGISDLEHALVSQWDLINSSAAISDFLDIMRKSSRPKGVILPMGFGLKKTITPDILKITEKYIEDLTDFTYKTDYYHYKFKKSFIKYQLDRYRWAIERLSKGKLRVANRRNIATCYFAHPTQEQFNTATKAYLDGLFASRAGTMGCTHVILDQAISVSNPDAIHRYFNKAKLIIVDRDPRDMYCDDVNWGDNMDDNYETKEAAERYVLRARVQREKIKEDPDVLYLKFEDLIINYEDTRKKICDFLGVSVEDHIARGKHLKTEVSIKNIGIWRKFYPTCKEAIDILEAQLADLCYDSSGNYESKNKTDSKENPRDSSQ